MERQPRKGPPHQQQLQHQYLSEDDYQEKEEDIFVTKSRPYDEDMDGDDHHLQHDDESCSNSRVGWSSRSSEYYSYMDDGWYFPQCMGKLTILYVVAIIVVIVTMATKSKRLNNNDHDNNINMTRQYTNMILALISCVMALHVFFRSSLFFPAGMTFMGRTMTFLLRILYG
jgi:hypothetical protein